MSEKTKSRIHFLILLNFCAIIAWYFWTNVRPEIIYAACSDVAEKTTGVSSRYELNYNKNQQYKLQKDDCLLKAHGR